MNTNKKTIIAIIGAGPAGLSAAYNLLKTNKNIKPILIEQESVVGGLSRTISVNQSGTDIGPHRFFTKNDDVWKLWTDILPLQNAPAADDILLNRNIDVTATGANPEQTDKVFLKRRRFSRIYYQKCFFDYPIKIQSVFKLGLKTTIAIGFSYLKSCFIKLKEDSLEAFMINRFGKKLYQLFFEDYTEKVWGVHPSKLSSQWGAQRIKGISLFRVLGNIISSTFHINKKKEISLIDEYYYPKLGSSQMWETIAQKITELGGEILLNHQTIAFIKENEKITSVTIRNIHTQEDKTLDCDMVISSMPIKELLTEMSNVPQDIYNIANNLQYRDFILVNYVLKNINLKNNTDFPTVNNVAPDSWIYLQDKNIKAGRLDIANNFSPYIIRDFKKEIVINLEYFCNETDEFWQKDDTDILNFATNELKKLHAADEKDIIFANVTRVKKAYPSYTGSYENFDKIKEYINSIPNLYCIGRNGQHKYNNMDHSVLDGIEIAKIINNNGDKTTLWDLNTENEYQEVKK